MKRSYLQSAQPSDSSNVAQRVRVGLGHQRLGSAGHRVGVETQLLRLQLWALFPAPNCQEETHLSLSPAFRGHGWKIVIKQSREKNL